MQLELLRYTDNAHNGNWCCEMQVSRLNKQASKQASKRHISDEAVLILLKEYKPACSNLSLIASLKPATKRRCRLV